MGFGDYKEVGVRGIGDYKGVVVRTRGGEEMEIHDTLFSGSFINFMVKVQGTYT